MARLLIPFPTKKWINSVFDYSDLDPFDYAMEDKYSVKVDRSVFDKIQPDLSSPSIKPDATKTFSIPRNASTKAIELDSFLLPKTATNQILLYINKIRSEYNVPYLVRSASDLPFLS